MGCCTDFDTTLLNSREKAGNSPGESEFFGLLLYMRLSPCLISLSLSKKNLGWKIYYFIHVEEKVGYVFVRALYCGQIPWKVFFQYRSRPNFYLPLALKMWSKSRVEIWRCPIQGVSVDLFLLDPFFRLASNFTLN